MSNGEPVKIESEEEVFDRLRLKWRRKFTRRSYRNQVDDSGGKDIASTSGRADAAKDGRRYEGGARK